MNKPPFGRALLCALLLAVAPVEAQTHRDKNNTTIAGQAPIYLYNALGELYVTSGQLASAFSLSPPTGATIAQICVETAGVRYRDNGIAPTASVGMPVVPSSSTIPSCFQYAGPLSVVQFIAISGSPTMDVFYYAAN